MARRTWQLGRQTTLACSIVLVVSAMRVAVGCEEAYEPPCRVTARSVLVADPKIASPLGIARTRGLATASWERREIADAGTDAAAIGEAPPIAAFEIAVVDERGGLGLRATVPAPDALHARRGSVTGAGAVVEDGGAFLVHWIETTTTTDPGGLIETNAALKVAYVIDGAASVVTAPPRASCERCTMTLAPASMGTESLIVVRMDREIPGAPLDAQPAPELAVLRFRRDGSVKDEPAPWLALPLAASSTSSASGVGSVAASRLVAAPTVRLDQNDRLVITAGGRAWLTDTNLRLLSGPVLLPNAADTRVSWEPTGEATVAWSVSPFDEGRASKATVPRDIFTGLVPNGASGVATRERVSQGRTTLAADRRGEDVGVLFESDERAIFASVDPHGRKRGGDVIVDTARRTSPTADPTAASASESHALFARGGGRFTTVTLRSGELVASEIVCAP